MKNKIIVTLLILFTSFYSIAQRKVPYNVVFDVTSSDTIVHKMVIRWVKEIMSSDPMAQIEIVFYAKSLDMITKDKSVVADSVLKYAMMKNVSFKVCEVAMKNNHVEKGQLLEGVQTVPDGIYEIVLREHDGWAYIKAAR